MEERRRQERSEAFKGIWRGWCFGDEEWRQELLAQMSEKVGSYHCGPEVRETADARAQRRVGQELRRRKWSETDLKKRPKGDPSKVAMAQRLRAETTVTLQWIGRRLPLGTKTHLAHLLCWERGKGIVQTS
jgi:hypothetical protein